MKLILSMIAIFGIATAIAKTADNSLKSCLEGCVKSKAEDNNNEAMSSKLQKPPGLITILRQDPETEIATKPDVMYYVEMVVKIIDFIKELIIDVKKFLDQLGYGRRRRFKTKTALKLKRQLAKFELGDAVGLLGSIDTLVNIIDLIQKLILEVTKLINELSGKGKSRDTDLFAGKVEEMTKFAHGTLQQRHLPEVLTGFMWIITMVRTIVKELPNFIDKVGKRRRRKRHIEFM